VGVLAIGVTSCRPVERCGPLADAEIAAIEETERVYIQQMLAGDWEAVAALFTEDAILMGFAEPLKTGRAVMLEHFAGIDSLTEFTITDSDIQGEGDLAFLRWGYGVTGFVGGGQDPISYAGKSVDILRRQPDGQWLFTLEIYNTDHSLAAEGSDT
jgi:ketosteroid isomerase-like protein